MIIVLLQMDSNIRSHKLSKPHRKLNANEGIWEDLRVAMEMVEGHTQGMEQLKVNTEIDFNLTFAYTESFPLALHE